MYGVRVNFVRRILLSIIFLLFYSLHMMTAHFFLSYMHGTDALNGLVFLLLIYLRTPEC